MHSKKKKSRANSQRLKHTRLQTGYVPNLNLTGNILLRQRILADCFFDAMNDGGFGGRAEYRKSSRNGSAVIRSTVHVIVIADPVVFAGLAQQPSVARALVAVCTERIVLQDCTAFGDVVSNDEYGINTQV